jgi:hypothetical protein
MVVNGEGRGASVMVEDLVVKEVESPAIPKP